MQNHRKLDAVANSKGGTPVTNRKFRPKSSFSRTQHYDRY